MVDRVGVSRVGSTDSFRSDASEPATVARTPKSPASVGGDSFDGSQVTKARIPMMSLEGHRASLQKALDDGNLDAVKGLYSKLDPKSPTQKQRIADLNNVRAGDGHSPMTLAAVQGKLADVEMLHGKGLDVNARGPGNKTAAELARIQGRKEIANFLQNNAVK